MNLTAFRLTNFKAFGATQRIPLRPITLIYGANSSGKSSVLHALALAHHAIESGDLDTQRTEIGGESIDLGGFRRYVHRREREREIEFGFDLDPRQLSGRTADLLRFAREIRVEVAIGESTVNSPQRLSSNDAEVRVERFAVDVNDRPLLSMSARAGGVLRLDRLDHSHPVFRDLLRGILMLATTTQEIHNEDFFAVGKEIDALVPEIVAKRRGLFPRIHEEVENNESMDEGTEAIVPISRGYRQENLASASRFFVPGVLRNLVGGLVSAIEDELRRLNYLGPLRSYPPRHLAFSQHNDPNWFAGGGYAWDVVRKNGDVRRRVNSWLGDPERLQTPYELEVRSVLPASIVAEELSVRLDHKFHDLLALFLDDCTEDGLTLLKDIVGNRLEKQLSHTGEWPAIHDVAAFSEIQEIVSAYVDTDNLSQRWVREMVKSRPETTLEVVLIDKRTGTPVSHRDVGIGVSQVLPVLVSAYVSKNTLLAIEQPEIHLHPGLQAELGDVFLESALGENGNTFLIETHSEHLILRILRRIRETTDGELPKGIPAVRPEQVAVLYVQPGSDGVDIIPIQVTPDGEFERAWPNGFFAERAAELF